MNRGEDAVSAEEKDKEKIINLAQAYEADILPRAEGNAAKLIREAEAHREQSINIATGKANKFLSVLSEYQKAPNVTRTRLYLEAVERFLPEINKIVVEDNINLVLVSSKDTNKQLLPLSTSPKETPEKTSGNE